MTPRTALGRDLGTFGATALGLGSIIGTGIFVSIGLAAANTGGAVVIAIAGAALLALANALSSAQLAAAYPVSGGTYEYGYRLLSPLLGFNAGWMFLCAKTASAATAAIGLSGYLLATAGIEGDTAHRVGAGTAAVVMTILVAAGLRRASVANAIMVSITVIGLLLFCGAALLEAQGRSDAPFVPPTMTARDLLGATALMFVAFTGYGRIATLGEEVRSPERTIPRAIVATLLITTVLLGLVGFAAVSRIGGPALARAAEEGGAPLHEAARSLSLPGLRVALSAAAITAMAGVLLNLLLGLSRVALAMARRGDLPRGLAVIDETAGPRRAVFAVGAAILLIAVSVDTRTAWSLSAFTVFIYYATTNLAALRLPPAARRFPRAVAWAGLAGCLFLAAWIPGRTWMIGLALLLVGAVWHTLRARSMAR